MFWFDFRNIRGMISHSSLKRASFGLMDYLKEIILKNIFAEVALKGRRYWAESQAHSWASYPSISPQEPPSLCFLHRNAWACLCRHFLWKMQIGFFFLMKERGWEADKGSHLCIHSPRACRVWAGLSLELGAGNSVEVSCLCGSDSGAWAVTYLPPPRSASVGSWVGSWTKGTEWAVCGLFHCTEAVI